MHVTLVAQQLVLTFEAIGAPILATDDLVGKDLGLEAMCSVMPCQLSPAGDCCVAVGCLAAVLILLVFEMRSVMMDEVRPVTFGLCTAVEHAWKCPPKEPVNSTCSARRACTVFDDVTC